VSELPAVAASVLQLLLGDIPPGEFFADIWQKRPLHVQGTPERFAGLFDESVFRKSATSCDHLKAYSTTAEGRVRELAISPDRIDAEFRAGATICISGINGHAPLNALIAGLDAEIAQAGEMSFNSYYSPEGKGFSLHFDDHPVWILQIAGRKEWKFSRTPFPNPLASITFHAGQQVASAPWSGTIPRPDETAFQQALLEPGDVLYLPEGTWHRAAAKGQSLALTLACNRASPLDLVQQALGPFIAGHPGLRQNLGGIWRHDLDRDSVPPEFESLFESALLELRGAVGGLTARDLYQAWLALANKGR
jgi:ribosomal protein L16 Arg81 hydroxylase